jgi:hypothetical protein
MDESPLERLTKTFHDFGYQSPLGKLITSGDAQHEQQLTFGFGIMEGLVEQAHALATGSAAAAEELEVTARRLGISVDKALGYAATYNKMVKIANKKEESRDTANKNLHNLADFAARKFLSIDSPETQGEMTDDNIKTIAAFANNGLWKWNKELQQYEPAYASVRKFEEYYNIGGQGVDEQLYQLYCDTHDIPIGTVVAESTIKNYAEELKQVHDEKIQKEKRRQREEQDADPLSDIKSLMGDVSTLEIAANDYGATTGSSGIQIDGLSQHYSYDNREVEDRLFDTFDYMFRNMYGDPKNPEYTSEFVTGFFRLNINKLPERSMDRLAFMKLMNQGIVSSASPGEEEARWEEDNLWASESGYKYYHAQSERTGVYPEYTAAPYTNRENDSTVNIFRGVSDEVWANFMKNDPRLIGVFKNHGVLQARWNSPRGHRFGKILGNYNDMLAVAIGKTQQPLINCLLEIYDKEISTNTYKYLRTGTLRKAIQESTTESKIKDREVTTAFDVADLDRPDRAYKGYSWETPPSMRKTRYYGGNYFFGRPAFITSTFYNMSFKGRLSSGGGEGIVHTKYFRQSQPHDIFKILVGNAVYMDKLTQHAADSFADEISNTGVTGG